MQAGLFHGGKTTSGFIELASKIESHVLNPSDTDVVLFDWTDYDGGGDNGFQNPFFGLDDFNPLQSANNGINIGESLVQWLDERGVLTYKRIHLLGHSSGSWLVDAMADELDKMTSADKVQLTLWDAFVPPGVYKQGVGWLSEENLGDNADFAEQYFDQGGFGLVTLYTQKILPKAVNIELSALGDPLRGPFASHAWPYVWFEQTITSPAAAIGAFGFPRAFSSTDVFPTQAGALKEGNRIILSDEVGNAAQIVEIAKDSVSFDKATFFITGEVIVDQAGGVDFATQSPALLTALLDLPNPVELIRFDFDFLNDTPAVFSLYVGTELVWELESSFLFGVSGLVDSGWLSVPKLAPGANSIIFRLDNLSDMQSRLRLENVEFGRLVEVAVPEPATIVLILLGVILSAGIRRR